MRKKKPKNCLLPRMQPPGEICPKGPSFTRITSAKSRRAKSSTCECAIKLGLSTHRWSKFGVRNCNLFSLWAPLETSGAQSKGFQCLKALILDLENSTQARTFGIGSKRFERKYDGISNVVYCDSPFEEQVVEFLENEGFEIECQYGAGKLWIDIVVKERGRNLLAIECDGAAYHSSLVARTRDRARQRILEKGEWRFHRVWSTNWWYFEQQEKEAIIGAINAARTDQSNGPKAPLSPH